MTDLVVAVLSQVSDGEQILTYGFSDRPYRDPALENTIVGGTFLDCIDPGSALSWSERIAFQPMGGQPSVTLFDLPLINREGDFDGWLDDGYRVAGLEQILKIGRPWQSWDEFELIAWGEGASLEWFGRERMHILTRDRFGWLRQPVATQVFDDSVRNERLRNTLAPLICGDCYQIPAIWTEPRFNRSLVALNLGLVRQVAEGGNPTPEWIEVVNGYQITQGTTEQFRQITCDAGGPPKPDHQLDDLLAEIGAFDEFDGADPAAPWVTYQSPPDSSIEQNVAGGVDVVSTVATADGSTGNNADVVAQGGGFWGWVGKDTGDNTVTDVSQWAGLVSDDDAAHLECSLGASQAATRRLTLTGFGFNVGSGTIPGITVGVRAAKSNSTTVTVSECRLLLPSGAVTANKANSEALSTSKTLHEFGASDDSWGIELNGSVLDDENFGLRLELKAGGGGIYPVTAEIFEIYITAHTASGGSQTLRLYVPLDLQPGDRYGIRFEHAGTDDSIHVRCGGVAAAGDPVPDLRPIPGAPDGGIAEELQADRNVSDPTTKTDGALVGVGATTLELVAEGPVLGIEFYVSGQDTGQQHLFRIACLELEVALNRLVPLVEWITEHKGRDPEAVLRTAALQALQDWANSPRLGWYVRDQTTVAQLFNKFEHSHGGIGWGGLEGLYECARMRLPGPPDEGEDYLILGPDRSAGPSHTYPLPSDALTDRVGACWNIHPIPEDRTAEITTTWTEEDRQLVVADARVIERATWDTDLVPRWPVPLTITGVSPNTGAEAGGTSVEITVSPDRVKEGASLAVYFDESAATNVARASDNTITCDAPEGTGTVDVLVEINGEQATLGGGYTYTAPASPPVWHTADQKVTSSDATSIDAPDNLQDGNLVILALFADKGNPDTLEFTVPAGFTLIRREGYDSYGRPVLDIYSKIADSEPASYTIGSSESNFGAVCGRVTGHDSSDPIGNQSGVNDVGFLSSITIPSVDVEFDNSLLFAMTAHQGTTSDPAAPAGMTLVVSGGWPRRNVAVQDVDAGATGGLEFTWTTGRYTCASAFAINPVGSSE